VCAWSQTGGLWPPAGPHLPYFSEVSGLRLDHFHTFPHCSTPPLCSLDQLAVPSDTHIFTLISVLCLYSLWTVNELVIIVGSVSMHAWPNPEVSGPRLDLFSCAFLRYLVVGWTTFTFFLTAQLHFCVLWISLQYLADTHISTLISVKEFFRFNTFVINSFFRL
jgi:hypothetical protein